MAAINSASSAASLQARENYIEIEGIPVPREYVDPVSFEIMTDPVIVQPSGISYDRATIEQLSSMQICLKDPMTGLYIQSFVSNRALRETIQRFCSAYPVLDRVGQSRQAPEVAGQNQVEDYQKYASHEFAALFNNRDEVEFPQNREIRIFNIDRKVMHDHLISETTESMASVLNSVLIVIGKRIAGVHTSGRVQVRCELKDKTEESWFSLQSDAPIKITVDRGNIITKISRLLDRMSRANIDILNLAPHQPLILRLSPADMQYLLRSLPVEKALEQLFFVRLPEKISSIELKARSLKVTRVTNEPNSIALIGGEGMRIQLIRKEQ